MKTSKKLDEALSLKQRLARRQMFRRMKGKIAAGRRRESKRLASNQKLKSRAERLARNMIVKKLTKGRSKQELSFSERERIEKVVAKRRAAVKRLAKKLFRQVKKSDIARKTGQSF